MGVKIKQVRNCRTCFIFTTTEQPFEQLVACSTDEDSATRGAIAKGNKRLVNGSCPKRANQNNQQITTASTFHYVGAVALYIIANKCKLTPVCLIKNEIDSMGGPKGDKHLPIKTAYIERNVVARIHTKIWIN